MFKRSCHSMKCDQGADAWNKFEDTAHQCFPYQCWATCAESVNHLWWMAVTKEDIYDSYYIFYIRVNVCSKFFHAETDIFAKQKYFHQTVACPLLAQMGLKQMVAGCGRQLFILRSGNFKNLKALKKLARRGPSARPKAGEAGRDQRGERYRTCTDCQVKFTKAFSVSDGSPV